MKVVEVAVGVLVDADDRVLITKRPESSHQGGLWEFPGGKLESGESVTEALGRELAEELGTRIGGATPLIDIEHDYGDKMVRLRVMQVTDWTGEPYGAEGQPMAWVARSGLAAYDFPEANGSIVALLVGEGE